MKKLIVAAAALMVGVAAYGQGQVLFNTHIDTVAARILAPDGTPATSGFIELGILSNGSFTAMTPDVTPVFKTSATGAGYVNAGNATAAGIADGTVVNLVLRAWQGPAGSTFANAAIKGSSELDGVTLHAGINAPGELVNGAGVPMAGFTMTPEPTTLALGAVGLGALLMFRRKA